MYSNARGLGVTARKRLTPRLRVSIRCFRRFVSGKILYIRAFQYKFCFGKRYVTSLSSMWRLEGLDSRPGGTSKMTKLRRKSDEQWAKGDGSEERCRRGGRKNRASADFCRATARSQGWMTSWKSRVASLMACVARERDASQRIIINYVLPSFAEAWRRDEGEQKRPARTVYARNDCNYDADEIAGTVSFFFHLKIVRGSSVPRAYLISITFS